MLYASLSAVFVALLLPDYFPLRNLDKSKCIVLRSVRPRSVSPRCFNPRASCLQAESRETRRFTDYSESDWVVDEAKLPALPGGFGWSCPPPKASHKLQLAEFQSRLRKVRTTKAVLLACFKTTFKSGVQASKLNTAKQMLRRTSG
jgi:hypothetical protein